MGENIINRGLNISSVEKEPSLAKTNISDLATAAAKLDKALKQSPKEMPQSFANQNKVAENNPISNVDSSGEGERGLTASERAIVQSAIDRIKGNSQWNHVGEQMQKILDGNHFKVNTDYSGTHTQGSTEHWDMFDRDIFLNPDLFDNSDFNNDWLIEILAHEYVHYNQFSAPVISHALYGIGNIADAIVQTITGDKDARVPAVSFEDGAYKFGERVRNDVAGW